MGMIERISDSRVVKCIKESCIVKLFGRFRTLFLSCWMLCDMALDFNQTMTFYQHGIGKKGIYQEWAEGYQIENNGTLQTVSPVYFYVACVVWVAPPILLAIFYTIAGAPMNAISLVTKMFKHEIDERILPSHKMLRFVLLIFLLPINVLCCIITIYFQIPFVAIKTGIKCAWNGSVDETEEIALGRTPEQLPMLKLFEYCGEALPQLILSVLFAVNNYHFLLDHDTLLDIKIPVTVVSIIFSTGSLIFGLVTGFKSCYEGFVK